MKKIQLPESFSGGGYKEWTAKVEGKEGEQSIKLRLGIGDGGGDSLLTQESKRVDDVAVFTPNQLNELGQQSLIFKHMAARLPVPLHLVVPIWNSVVSSLGTDNGGIYKLYPSFVGWSPECFDYRNMVDPEPGRCRRTDGKKWRCGKNVIPNQKYCERHMHRGRQRSRKLVEASKIARPLIAVPLNTKPYEKPKPIFNRPLLVTHNNNNNNNNSSISNRDKTRVAISSHPVPAFAIPVSTIRTNTSAIVPSLFKPGKVSVIHPASINAGATSTTSVVTEKNNTNSKTEGKIDAKGVHEIGESECDIKIRFSRSPGLDLSPTSVVLQAQGCKSCVNVAIDCEPGRCRRTDGKKWRCSRDVVPTQKYCPKHMHRGAKRHMSDSKRETCADTKAVPNEAPNTNLSIFIPANRLLNEDDEKSPKSNDEVLKEIQRDHGSSVLMMLKKNYDSLHQIYVVIGSYDSVRILHQSRQSSTLIGIVELHQSESCSPLQVPVGSAFFTIQGCSRIFSRDNLSRVLYQKPADNIFGFIRDQRIGRDAQINLHYPSKSILLALCFKRRISK